MIGELPASFAIAALDDAAHIPDGNPAVEPPLCVDNIQGNSLAGFNKDRQTLICFIIEDVGQFKLWLAREAVFISTLAEVLAFNRLFKSILSRRQIETRAVQSTWINIAFSFAGLSELDPVESAKFADPSFKAGLAAQSASLGDPQGAADEGAPSNWVVGGPGGEPHGMIIVAGDDESDVAFEVRRIEDRIYGGRVADSPGSASSPGSSSSGLRIVYKQHGATLPAPLTGHEHFGWLDGVSQPGVRGVVSPMVDGNHRDLLTLRQNSNEAGQGKPGQDCLYPGEFVFGYQGQDPNAVDMTVPGPVKQAGPVWSDDGSLVVFRRLRQDVASFRNTLLQQAKILGVSDVQLGAKLVGRWPSGSPIMVDDQNDPQIGADDGKNNFFEFATAPSFGAPAIDGSQFSPGAPPAADPNGAKCPLSAHIRKAYPRDDVSSALPDLREQTTQTHRMLRRGIPFGKPYADDPKDLDERGLLFISYQTSIENQFEFVTKSWINDPAFKEPGVGLDPIIGQASGGGTRSFRTVYNDEYGNPQPANINFASNFVIPTGGGYYFSPSIDALYRLAGVAAPPNLHCQTHPPQSPPSNITPAYPG